MNWFGLAEVPKTQAGALAPRLPPLTEICDHINSVFLETVYGRTNPKPRRVRVFKAANNTALYGQADDGS